MSGYLSVEQIRTYLQDAYLGDLSDATFRNVPHECFPELADGFSPKDDCAPGQLVILNERHQDDLGL